MSILSRFSTPLIAAAVLATLAWAPAMAQVSPAAPRVGPAGGAASTTAPSNSEGTPAGGTGVVGTTRVGPTTAAPATSYAAPGDTVASPPPRRTRRARRARRARARAGMSTGAGSSAGLNGSNAPATSR